MLGELYPLWDLGSGAPLLQRLVHQPWAAILHLLHSAGSSSTGLPLRSGHSSAAVSSCAYGSNEPFPNLGRLEVAPGVRTPSASQAGPVARISSWTGSPPGLRWPGPGWVRQWCPRRVRWARCSALLPRGPDHESVKRGVFAAGSMLAKLLRNNNTVIKTLSLLFPFFFSLPFPFSPPSPLLFSARSGQKSMSERWAGPSESFYSLLSPRNHDCPQADCQWR